MDPAAYGTHTQRRTKASLIYRRTKNRPMAQEHLITTTTMYRDMGMRYWLNETERKINHRA